MLYFVIAIIFLAVVAYQVYIRYTLALYGASITYSDKKNYFGELHLLRPKGIITGNAHQKTKNGDSTTTYMVAKNMEILNDYIQKCTDFLANKGVDDVTVKFPVKSSIRIYKPRGDIFSYLSLFEYE